MIWQHQLGVAQQWVLNPSRLSNSPSRGWFLAHNWWTESNMKELLEHCYFFPLFLKWIVTFYLVVVLRHLDTDLLLRFYVPLWIRETPLRQLKLKPATTRCGRQYKTAWEDQDRWQILWINKYYVPVKRWQHYLDCDTVNSIMYAGYCYLRDCWTHNSLSGCLHYSLTTLRHHNQLWFV